MLLRKDGGVSEKLRECRRVATNPDSMIETIVVGCPKGKTIAVRESENFHAKSCDGRDMPPGIEFP